ncbi:MAG: PIG-L deacetylase family protein [Deltaproteobacteria bacterium]
MSWACPYKGYKPAARRAVGCALALLLALAGSSRAAAEEAPYPAITFDGNDRILVLAPHPDDEILGCGGVIQQARDMGLPLKIVFLTYGDNNQWSFLVYRKHPVLMPGAALEMGLVRYREARQAAAVLGIPPDDLVFLGYPDYRTLEIWRSHWGDAPAARSMLTDVRAVPYDNALRPHAPYKGEEILKDLEAVITDFRPTKIFLSHPADHNADHQALYLFTRVALWDLGGGAAPVLYPYLIHFRNWPVSRGYLPDRDEDAPAGLENAVFWRRFGLSPEETVSNRRAIEKHRSQIRSSRKYLLSFIRADEIFGDFPQVSLREFRSPLNLSRHSPAYLGALPEELIEEEKVLFVGIEEEFLTLEDGALVFTLKLSRPVSGKVRLSLAAFGYRSDRPFGRMPKIRVVLRKNSHKVYDQGRTLASSRITVDRTPRRIDIRIPLEVLGDPQRILTSARTYMGLVPLDWVEWRVLVVGERAAGGGVSPLKEAGGGAGGNS